MDIPAFVYWIVIGGIVLAIIASILSYKFIRPKPLPKRRLYLSIIFFSAIALTCIIALFSGFPFIDLIKPSIIMLITLVLIYIYAMFIDPIIRKKKGMEE